MSAPAVPPRYGFNVQWAFVKPGAQLPPPDERLLDFIAEYGFDFVRVPTDYRVWAPSSTYSTPGPAALAALGRYVEACRARGIHLSLNLHRAPGYCITGWEQELDNLWRDSIAQDAFVRTWTAFAVHFIDVPGEWLSFDLVNEPPAIGLRGFNRDDHEALIRRCVAAIRAVDPKRPLIIDGLDGGNLAMPELGDLGLVHGTRGYAPYPVSHWGADWWQGWREGDAPRWPGVEYQGRAWTVDDLRGFYAPWREVEAAGTPVHVGEFGCYRETPNADALRWFRDLLGLFAEFGWGYALWEFEGPFGIVGHGRAGARIEPRGGYMVDVELLELLRGARHAVGITA